MILAFALLLGTVSVAVIGPAVLNLMVWRNIDPHIVLVTWIVLVGATFLTMVATLGVILLPTHGPAPALLEFVHHCWFAITHGAFPGVHEMAALAVLLVVAIPSAIVGRGLLRFLRHQRRLHSKHLELLRITSACEPGAYTTMWLPHQRPLAYSVSGSPAIIVATDGVRQTLTNTDTAAVLEHERAHLRGHHHLLVGLADVLANSVPWAPLMKHSPALVRTAVELAADRAAAREHGTGPVRSALRRMSAHGGSSTPQHALGMADDSVALRLNHLDKLTTRDVTSTARRLLLSGFAGVVAASSPVLTGMGILMTIGLVTCLL